MIIGNRGNLELFKSCRFIVARWLSIYGVPRDKIVIADIADMSIERSIVSQRHLETVFSESSTQPDRLRVKSGSVDHIFSHSVIWALSRPAAFFGEAQRVLKP